MNYYLVEFLGTLFLSFVIFATGNYLAIGAAVAVAVLLAGSVFKNAAFNPAITIALLSAGKLSTNDVVPYIVAQIAGALAGFELVKLLIKK
jgi:glycerol uptake facilitator-like aquaporin